MLGPSVPTAYRLHQRQLRNGQVATRVLPGSGHLRQYTAHSFELRLHQQKLQDLRGI